MITLTPEQIEQLRKSAATACNDRNGGETCLHMRADELLALATMAQECERLRDVVRVFLHVYVDAPGIWVLEGEPAEYITPTSEYYELAELALECMSDGDA